ncbi:urease accessory protein UreE [Marinobacter sp. F4218]|uniref:urease accessory protein UreE n=1 Tax=Marinobacter sp. F4218 TaxID=2862868 RepID=UPI001C62B4B4|nr:urease accessory protein UreE [Marinobacter sp. F4218]MBW7470890.1 urease accessory protein UreE [Marinobacter sp. F4218]
MLELTQRVGPVETTEIHDHLTLPFELRMRGRLRTKTDTGYDVGLFLDRGPVLREGAFLQAETGEIIRIRAADEPVVTAHIEPGLAMARLCYHLGNRHVSLAIGSDESREDGQTGWVRFPPDHVLEELAERLGATLEHHRAPFDPEPGAYAQAGNSNGHSHGHSHSHGHHHDHAHSH